MKYEVIPSVRYRNVLTQATASIYGCVPWRGDKERQNWISENVGWTVRNPFTNQIGIGRNPWANKDAAQKFADEHRPSRISFGD